MTQSPFPDDLTRRLPNYFAFGGIDRSAHVREQGGLDAVVARPDTRLVPVWRSRNLFADRQSGDAAGRRPADRGRGRTLA